MSTHNLIRWSGISLFLAGVLLTLGTIIHPSNETPQTIINLESRLVGGHWLLTFYAAFLMLGLPGVYASHAKEFGRLGLASFLLLFFGTLFYAISSDYGFNAPVLAKLAPPTLDAINAYPPVVVMDGLFVVLLLFGFILFGITLRRSHLYTTWSAVLIIFGWPIFMIASAIALLVFEPVWYIAILGAACLGAGLCGVGVTTWNGNLSPLLHPSETPSPKPDVLQT
jgi:hypothetical protein